MFASLPLAFCVAAYNHDAISLSIIGTKDVFLKNLCQSIYND